MFIKYGSYVIILCLLYINSCPIRENRFNESRTYAELPYLSNVNMDVKRGAIYLSGYLNGKSYIQKHQVFGLDWEISINYNITKIVHYIDLIYVVGDNHIHILNEYGVILYSRLLYSNKLPYHINSIFIHEINFYLTGHINNTSFIAQYNRNGLIWQKLLYNNSTGIDVMVDKKDIYVAGIINKDTFIIKLNHTHVIWKYIFEPFRYSTTVGLSMNEQVISIAGSFSFNIKINDNIRLVACGFGNDSYLVSINKSGNIVYAGSFCGSHTVITSFSISNIVTNNNCYYYYIAGLFNKNMTFIGTNLLSNITDHRYNIEFQYMPTLIKPVISVTNNSIHFIYVLLRQSKTIISRLRII